MNWFLLAKIINGILLLISVYFVVINKPILLLPTLFIAMGLHGFNFLLGTIWFPFKIVNIVIFLYTFTKIPTSKINSPIFQKFFLAFFISILPAFLNIPDNEVNTGILQSPAIRPIIQIYTYISTFSLIVFIPYVINSDIKFLKVDKYYMRISELIIIIGLVHFIFIRLGLNFIPIIRAVGEQSDVAKFSASGIIMNRIYGFTGEPKTLGTMLLPYFFISLYKLTNNIINRNKKYHSIFLFLSLFVIIQTYSSSALIAVFFSLTIGFLFGFYKINNPLIIKPIFIVLIFILIGNSLIKDQKYERDISYLDFLYERSFGRVEEEIDERTEMLLISDLIENQPLFVMGYGPGMYVFALPGLVFGRGVNKIDSGWLTIFFDLGIIGIIVYVTTFIKKISIRNYLSHKYKHYYNAYLLGFISVIAGMLGNFEVLLFPLFLGFLITILQLNKIDHFNKNISSSENSKKKD